MQPEYVGPGVDGVVEHRAQQAVLGSRPPQFARAKVTYRQFQPMIRVVPQHRVGTALKAETLEDQAHSALHLLIGVETKPAGGFIPLITRRWQQMQLAT